MIPSIYSPRVITAVAGQPFAYQIEATNNPDHFNATDMPEGLSIDRATGLISGAPLVEEPVVIWFFPISATNADGTRVVTIQLTIYEAPSPPVRPVITSALSANATADAPFRYQITARNDPTDYVVQGLPPGLILDDARRNGVIYGTPTLVGRWRVVIGASNAAGVGTATLILNIAAPAVDDPRWCTIPRRPNESGPDVPAIQCWPWEGCCGPDPCAITEAQFICAIRSLLPEGDIYNNTRIPTAEPAINAGTITVGCAHVGCEQLIFGGCCEDRILCDDEPIAPQLAVVDSYAASAFGVIRAICAMLRELEPCTSNVTMRKWGERYGIRHPDPCSPGWSDNVLAFLICVLFQIRQHVINWDYLVELGKMFGASLTLRYAGDLNGGPSGWWTMARDQVMCDQIETCPPDQFPPGEGYLTTTAECESLPLSLNLITCPAAIERPDNCNLPITFQSGPHDPEIYLAFKWLLPYILPQPVFWCIYECDPENCIV